MSLLRLPGPQVRVPAGVGEALFVPEQWWPRRKNELISSFPLLSSHSLEGLVPCSDQNHSYTRLKRISPQRVHPRSLLSGCSLSRFSGICLEEGNHCYVSWAFPFAILPGSPQTSCNFLNRPALPHFPAPAYTLSTTLNAFCDSAQVPSSHLTVLRSCSRISIKRFSCISHLIPTMILAQRSSMTCGRSHKRVSGADFIRASDTRTFIHKQLDLLPPAFYRTLPSLHPNKRN